MRAVFYCQSVPLKVSIKECVLEKHKEVKGQVEQVCEHKSTLMWSEMTCDTYENIRLEKEITCRES